MVNKSSSITLRCYPDLKERIVNLAKKEHRTQSAQVIHLLEMALDVVETQEVLEPPPTSSVSVPYDDVKKEGLAEWGTPYRGGERHA